MSQAYNQNKDGPCLPDVFQLQITGKTHLPPTEKMKEMNTWPTMT